MRRTVNTQAGLPAAAPSQSMSWLPHCMSIFGCCISISTIRAGSGPRSKMSPTTWSLSTARRFMSSARAAMSLRGTTLPSMKPALMAKRSPSRPLANLYSTRMGAMGSSLLTAREVVPWSTSSSSLSPASSRARRTRVFFTTEYSTPALRSSLRRVVSSDTVIPS